MKLLADSPCKCDRVRKNGHGMQKWQMEPAGTLEPCQWHDSLARKNGWDGGTTGQAGRAAACAAAWTRRKLMSDRMSGSTAPPGRLLAAADPGRGPAAKALDLLSILIEAIEQAPGMAMRGLDRDGVVRYWSAGAARLYGVSIGQAMGQHWRSVAGDWSDGAVPDAAPGLADGAGFAEELASVWQT